MSKPKILVADSGDQTQVRVAGRGTFVTAGIVRDFAMKRMDEGARIFLFDLSECPSLDSTFMGVLATIALRGRKRSAAVQIVNANSKIEQATRILGLKELFVFSHTEGGSGDWTELSSAVGDSPEDESARRRMILAAHETLAGVHPDNEPRFRDLIDMMRIEINGNSGTAPPA